MMEDEEEIAAHGAGSLYFRVGCYTSYVAGTKISHFQLGRDIVALYSTTVDYLTVLSRNAAAIARQHGYAFQHFGSACNWVVCNVYFAVEPALVF